ncbi:uncharacterized protein PFL1_04865 [Pseudozyma flocculosa PF-1]|uniref:Related to Tctex2-related inner arm dynein light chain n=2 Tax=Pseudozyma flocculosa TaxID=84751 RepID=A0A5C3F3Q7_9BASI|nr:uncharacterized protein PFL1_04865 [Pseudozyma flocculosa PF-1]EPQ27728.1 hypothetical protein PFL1_04865 [Pseudozyma flocculosa PF-1]SPO39133.1 related to Tctex2-related inner arm dynein light chain [Pseudozyma flocculosa]
MASPSIGGPTSPNGFSAMTSPLPSSHPQLGSSSTRPSAPPSSADGSASLDSAPPSASAPPSRTRFDPQGALQSQLSHILSSRLKTERWDKQDKAKNRALSRGVAETVKARMLDIEPKGFKFIVQVQLVENLGQGGRGALSGG